MTTLPNVLQFAWTYLRRYWARLFFGLFFGVLFGLSNASFVWATRTLVERLDPSGGGKVEAAEPLESEGKDQSAFKQRLEVWDAELKQRLEAWLPRVSRPLDGKQILGALLFLPVLVSFRGGAGYLSSYCMGWVSERVVNDLRYDILRKLSTLSLEFYNRSRTGDLLARINQDTVNLQRALRAGFPDLVKESITILSILAVLCVIDWKLTLFSMVILPVCLAPVLVLGKKARKASRASIKASVSQFNQLVELFSSIRVIKAFALEKVQLERFRRLSKELVRQGVKGVKAKEMVNPAIEIISTAAIGLFIIYLVQAERTIGDVVAFLTGLIFFYTPVKKLAGIHVLMEQTSVGVHRLIEVMEETPMVQESACPKRLEGFRERIEFAGVQFTYGDAAVLRDIDLSIPRGFKLGVAGASGSGKSTLVNLLFRFYDPTAGAIRIDGIDLREIATGDLRQLMALVSQEVVLFDQTVAENIACGRPGATEEEVREAARAAYAHDFIMQLPQGYDSLIGERGVRLSGGQRQRLAIARAFIRNAPILVLDEATAALDSKSEAEVQAAIDHLAEHRTVVCVAHRLSTLAAMDSVVVLAEGKIIEHGGFSELLQAGGMFAAMAQQQGINLGNGLRAPAAATSLRR